MFWEKPGYKLLQTEMFKAFDAFCFGFFFYYTVHFQTLDSFFQHFFYLNILEIARNIEKIYIEKNHIFNI